MARDPSPQCKQCRREGKKLYLKGERCLTDKCGVERRAYPPGDHGRGRQKQSEYRLQLREKQKARRYYGVLERSSATTTPRRAASPASRARTCCACSRPVRQRAGTARLRGLAPPGAAARSSTATGP